MFRFQNSWEMFFWEGLNGKNIRLYNTIVASQEFAGGLLLSSLERILSIDWGMGMDICKILE